MLMFIIIIIKIEIRKGKRGLFGVFGRGVKILLDSPGERLLLDAFVIRVVSSKVLHNFIDGGMSVLARLDSTDENLVVKNRGRGGGGTAAA